MNSKKKFIFSIGVLCLFLVIIGMFVGGILLPLLFPFHIALLIVGIILLAGSIGCFYSAKNIPLFVCYDERKVQIIRFFFWKKRTIAREEVADIRYELGDSYWEADRMMVFYLKDGSSIRISPISYRNIGNIYLTLLPDRKRESEKKYSVWSSVWEKRKPWLLHMKLLSGLLVYPFCLFAISVEIKNDLNIALFGFSSFYLFFSFILTSFAGHVCLEYRVMTFKTLFRPFTHESIEYGEIDQINLYKDMKARYRIEVMGKNGQYINRFADLLRKKDILKLKVFCQEMNISFAEESESRWKRKKKTEHLKSK